MQLIAISYMIDATAAAARFVREINKHSKRESWKSRDVIKPGRKKRSGITCSTCFLPAVPFRVGRVMRP